MKCLCGKEATYTVYLPIPNVYVGLKQVLEKHFVCEYHAKKAEDKGYKVDKLS
mgnify:CR=1 FL=1